VDRVRRGGERGNEKRRRKGRKQTTLALKKEEKVGIHRNWGKSQGVSGVILGDRGGGRDIKKGNTSQVREGLVKKYQLGNAMEEKIVAITCRRSEEKRGIKRNTCL